MALAWRFIVESELRAGGICVWSTARGGDSRSRPGPTTCWGNSPIGGQAKTDPRTITMNWRSHMTLIKSILLGSAAGIVAVATAQAADLPTRKAAPVEYVRVCNVGGITGWTLPGSDTCVKFSGYSPRRSRAATSAPSTIMVRSETRLRPPRILWFPRVPLSRRLWRAYPVSTPAILSGSFFRPAPLRTTRPSIGTRLAGRLV